MEPFRRKIVAKIKAELKAAGKTQEKLAYEIDMSKGFLGEVLSGKKSFRIEVLKRIADGLGVKAKDLLPDE
jgi:transcriptional regulator with XRE-family HTH domain